MVRPVASGVFQMIAGTCYQTRCTTARPYTLWTVARKLYASGNRTRLAWHGDFDDLDLLPWYSRVWRFARQFPLVGSISEGIPPSLPAYLTEVGFSTLGEIASRRM